MSAAGQQAAVKLGKREDAVAVGVAAAEGARADLLGRRVLAHGPLGRASAGNGN